jgi:hypothetical protein
VQGIAVPMFTPRTFRDRRVAEGGYSFHRGAPSLGPFVKPSLVDRQSGDGASRSFLLFGNSRTSLRAAKEAQEPNHECPSPRRWAALLAGSAHRRWQQTYSSR